MTSAYPVYDHLDSLTTWCSILWVPSMSSKYPDQDFPGMAQQDETGPWPYRFSTSPSPGFSSWCA
jgi:hypothetical protein